MRQVYGCTDIGQKRQANQDAYALGHGTDAVWAVVCDGMGGANAGGVASSMAVDSIKRSFEKSLRADSTDNNIKNLLISALAGANAGIFAKAAQDASCSGMGTTVVAVVVKDNIAHIAHAGDSRAYLISGNTMEQITKDHSLVQALIEKGKLTEDEALFYPDKNLITRALGVEEEISIDYSETYMKDEDILLICTDGLTNVTADREIFEVVAQGPDEGLARRLVDQANRNGGVDNITVVLVLPNRS